MIRPSVALVAAIVLAASPARLCAQRSRPAPASPVDTNSAVVKKIRGFMQTVSTSDAPFGMRTETLRRVDALLARATTDEIAASADLTAERATFVERMALVAEFDALAAKVYKDVPQGNSDFIKNSREEITRYRNNVGNPAGYANRDTYEAVRHDYEQRLALLKIIVQIREGVSKLEPAARVPLQARLDTLTWSVDRYEMGKRADVERIREMHKEIVKPKP